jgi:hypothetical protein
MNPAGPTNGLYNLVLPSSCGGGPGGVLRELKAIPGCNRVAMGVSPLPVSVAAHLVTGLETYLTIHIRRTDTLHNGCDTSPAKVRLYLNCWVGQFNGSFPAIVLFTDDTDEAFLSEVLSVLGEFALKVVHCDAAAKVRFKELGVDADTDNYLVYEVSVAIRNHPSLQKPGRIKLEFGGHGPGIAEQCARKTACERNGNAGLALAPPPPPPPPPPLLPPPHKPLRAHSAGPGAAASGGGGAKAAAVASGCAAVRDPPLSCARPCDGFPSPASPVSGSEPSSPLFLPLQSVIVLDDPPSAAQGASLMDRSTMIAGMALFAEAIGHDKLARRCVELERQEVRHPAEQPRVEPPPPAELGSVVLPERTVNTTCMRERKRSSTTKVRKNPPDSWSMKS